VGQLLLQDPRVKR